MKLLVAFFSVKQTSESREHSRAAHLWVQDPSVPCRGVWVREPGPLMWCGAGSWHYSHAVSKHITLRIPTPPEPPTSVVTKSEVVTNSDPLLLTHISLSPFSSFSSRRSLPLSSALLLALEQFMHRLLPGTHVAWRYP